MLDLLWFLPSRNARKLPGESKKEAGGFEECCSRCLATLLPGSTSALCWANHRLCKSILAMIVGKCLVERFI